MYDGTGSNCDRIDKEGQCRSSERVFEQKLAECVVIFAFSIGIPCGQSLKDCRSAAALKLPWAHKPFRRACISQNGFKPM